MKTLKNKKFRTVSGGRIKPVPNIRPLSDDNSFSDRQYNNNFFPDERYNYEVYKGDKLIETFVGKNALSDAIAFAEKNGYNSYIDGDLPYLNQTSKDYIDHMARIYRIMDSD